MATKKTHGKSQSGRPPTDELVVELCEKAGAGVDVEEIERRRGGRPPMGSAPASVESVRLDPELRQALLDGADREQHTQRMQHFAQLKPREREALYLKALGHSYQEIAAPTNATYTAVNRRLAEARARLRKLTRERDTPLDGGGEEGGEDPSRGA